MKQYFIAALIMISASLLGGSIVFAAQSVDPLSKIQFPIASLGNCGSEAECKTFCESPDNMQSCVSFAEKNGLASAEDVARAKEFQDVLRGDGPGKCKDKAGCETYCDDVNNIDECLNFAAEHNLIPADELAQAKMVIPLMKKGETPGKCISKQSCESYCEAEDHAVECVNFAEKAGFISKDEADIVRKTGGKGPGGCRSKESCDAYCNDDKNAKQCFDFAKQYNLIPADKLKEMEEGMGKLKTGLEQATPEVLTCLKSKLGDDVVSRINDGSYTPTKKDGEVIQKCFEGMKEEGMRKLDEGLSQMPPEAGACVRGKLGENYAERIQSGKLGQAEIMAFVAECMANFKPDILKDIPDENYRPSYAPPAEQ
jgi:hypothetical protein